MIDQRTQSRLQEIVRRESRSFLQFVSEAFPWITSREQDALARLQKSIGEEQQAAAALGRFLYRHKAALPALGVYPIEFTNFSYVSLDHLLPILADFQNRAIADLERDLEQLKDAEARMQVQRILEMKRRHLQDLKSLAAKPAGERSEPAGSPVPA